MKHPIDTMTTPRGGWTVEFPTGARITSNHYMEFLAACFRHMEATEQDTSAGWQDRVWNMVCEQTGVPCMDNDKPEAVFNLDDLRRFALTMTKWLASGGGYVTQELAEKRALVCRECPNNYPLAGCGACKGPLKLLVETIGGRKTQQNEFLHSCKVCHCYLNAKVWLPLEVFPADEEKNVFPPNCWMITEKEKR